MSLIPSDVEIGGVYFPPLLVVFFLAFAAMVVTAVLLNRYRLSRHFIFPTVVLAAITTIYTVIIGTFLIPI